MPRRQWRPGRRWCAVQVWRSGFEIERSLDGKNYEQIGWKNAKGKENQNTDYNFQDNHPVFNQLLYYRLKAYDKDGSFEYSKIKTVQLNRADLGISIFPNPNTGRFFIQSSLGNQPLSLTIYNNIGQKVIEANIQSDYVDYSSLKSGIYFLKITSDTSDEVIKKMIVYKLFVSCSLFNNFHHF